MSLVEDVARGNLDYVEALYRDYRADPAAVDGRWAELFQGFDAGPRGEAEPAARHAEAGAGGDRAEVQELVHCHRELGHLVADLDPLGGSPRSNPLLCVDDFNVTDAELDRVVDTAPFRGAPRMTLRELIEALRETYCGTLAVEYLGITDKAQRDWLQQRMESRRNRPELSAAERRAILTELVAAETFEHFLQARYTGQKRFSLEGGEALVVLLDTLVEESARLDAGELVMGMPHRGRLNVLAHVLRKPYELILAEFEGTALPEDITGDGDVKYHLGYSVDRVAAGERRVHLSLASNPSHLEAIDPVVEGMARAKQTRVGDRERRRVVPVLLHGDAAFVGQGIVYETLALSTLPGYTTGGTIHVIIDNQIGFTASPDEYLVTRYPSDPANVIHAPVFHVNGDDPEAALQAARLAAGFREKFGGDVFIHFLCYRRHGHNELDDPTFTQPRLYERIRTHPSVVARYAERLVGEGALDASQVAALGEERKAALERALRAARATMPPQQVMVLGGAWAGLDWAGDDWSARTGVDAERLRAIADAARRLPAGFTPHRRAQRLLDDRYEAVRRGDGIDWGGAETLAYGSLLLEGFPVRLSGQDSVRGTFSHRHAALVDTKGGERYVPLAHLGDGQAPIEVINSPLSEAGVLGFEYGMSSADPRRLVIWEAQFGDFASGAQAIIDEFIAAGESKWQRMSGLVLFLPHGYEGQGPDHSSARLERFLQLCAEDNLQVIVPTTPAQLFHALRRQMHRRFRKPVIVMTPKSLLRHPRAVSSLAEFSTGEFRLVIDDARAPAAPALERLLICAGKIFYELDERRAARTAAATAIVRLEQLYPFPTAEVAALLRRHARAGDVCWVQEEPANQGAWGFVRPRLEALLEGRRALRYVGRPEAASPATGNHKVHQAEEQKILEDAFTTPGAARRAVA